MEKRANNVSSKDSKLSSRSPDATKTSNTGRWVPLHNIQDIKDINEAVFRKARGILNKLTPEKFDRLVFELLNLGINSKTILKGIILLIFEKALEEPKYSSLYARLCLRLSHDAPNFDDPSSNSTSFRRLLLSKCQEEFESRANATAAFDRRDGSLSVEEQEEKALAKRKMLGNIKFIGELGKFGMLHEAILHKCIQQLLAKKKKANVADMGEDIECLCQIMATVGKRLDVPKAKNIMDQYFDRMEMLAESPELPSRIKFMLEDTIELRRNAWVSRRIKTSEAGPIPVSTLRWEAFASSPVPPPPFMQLPFPTPFGMPPLGMFGQPMHPMMTRGMFSPGTMNPMMPDMSMVQDAQKDIFGKDPTPKNQQLMKKIKDKSEDLFEPHYLKNKHSTTPPTLAAPASVAAQQLAPKQTRSYASASLPSNQKPTQQQQMPAKKYDFFDNEDFGDIMKTPRMPAWNPDPFAKSATPPPVQRMQQNHNAVDSNFNQVSQQNIVNKAMVNGGPQDITNPFPFSRSSVQKSGNISLRPTTSLSMTKNDDEGKVEKVPSKAATNPVNLIIKDKQEKPKTKKNALSKPEFERRVEIVLKQNSSAGNIENAVQALKLITTSQLFGKMLARKVLKDFASKDKTSWDYIGKLLGACQKNDVIASDTLQNSLTTLADDIERSPLENGVDYFSTICASLVEQGVLSFMELHNFFLNGVLYPGFINALKLLAAEKGKEWLSKRIEDENIKVLNTLPVEKQTEKDLLEVAKEADIKFLFPVLFIQSQFEEVLKNNDGIDNLRNWIEGTMEPAFKEKKMFIQSFLLCILKHALSQNTLMNGLDTNQIPEKELQEKEKESIRAVMPLIKSFLLENSKLQVEAVYILQQFCFMNDFPRGMLLRLFIAFYDLEIIEEDAYLRWKEDINDVYPGKGKALFQVNTWLQWLETADEEDESDEEQT